MDYILHNFYRFDKHNNKTVAATSDGHTLRRGDNHSERVKNF